jgi:uncharacterized protein
MTDEMREQMLDVLFGSSEEELNEGVVQNIGRAVGTAVKHGAQNVVNQVKNDFAFTDKQKAQAANRTATLKATQAAEKAGNKAIAKAGKAGKATYKNVMSNWSIQNANKAMQAAINNAQDVDTIVSGLEYALCGINVLNAGKAQGEQSEVNSAKTQVANDSNKNIRNSNVEAAKDDKTNAMNATGNVSGNNNQPQGGQNNG